MLLSYKQCYNSAKILYKSKIYPQNKSNNYVIILE